MTAKWLAVAVVLLAGTAFADEIELTTGEVLRGSNVLTSDGRVQMDHPILGHLSIPWDLVAKTRVDDSSDLAAAVAVVPKADVPAPAPAPPKPTDWKFKIEFGLTGTSGNTHTRDLHLAGQALLELPEHRWKFDAERSTSKNDGEKTRDQWYVQGLKDWMWVGSPWIAFATARYDSDKFQQWDSRISAGVGAGYKIIDETDLKLRGRFGLATAKERGSDDERWRPEGLLGLDGSWQISPSQKIEAASTLYPDLRGGGNYRLLSSVAWSIKLSEAEALSLKIGVEDEYDTHRTDPFDSNDVKYFAAILFEF